MNVNEDIFLLNNHAYSLKLIRYLYLDLDLSKLITLLASYHDNITVFDRQLRIFSIFKKTIIV